MRRLLVLVIGLAALWSGYWFVAARGLEAGVSAWLEAQRAVGWRMETSAMNVRGFPNRLDLVADSVAVQSPDGTVGWSAPFLQVMALSYRPNHLVAVWPQEQVVTTLAGPVTVKSQDMRASAVLQPGTGLPLDRAAMVIEAPRLEMAAGTLAAMTARLAVREAPPKADTYEIGLEATELVLSGLLPEGWPTAAERIWLDADLTLDAPLDRFALERAPQVTAVDLRAFDAVFGGTHLNARGTVTLRPDGRPEGDVTLRATGWRGLLRMAEAAGALSEEDAQRAEVALALLAGGEDKIEAPLEFRGGRMFLGPVPIGPAPRLR